MIIIDFERAVSELINSKVCNGVGFFTDDNKSVDIENLRFMIYGEYFSGKLTIGLITHSADYGDGFYQLDPSLYNFIKEK